MPAMHCWMLLHHRWIQCLSVVSVIDFYSGGASVILHAFLIEGDNISGLSTVLAGDVGGRPGISPVSSLGKALTTGSDISDGRRQHFGPSYYFRR